MPHGPFTYCSRALTTRCRSPARACLSHAGCGQDRGDPSRPGCPGPTDRVLPELVGVRQRALPEDAGHQRHGVAAHHADVRVREHRPGQPDLHGRAAAGVFDGIDLDWEFPATEARAGNHYGPQDTANFTALLAEFRSQLDALGGAHRSLTAAVPAGPDAIVNLQLSQLGTYLDLANVMSYDMHGAWETAGPTNFNAPLYDSPASPSAGGKMTADDAVKAYLAGGFPAGKLTLGVPFYARGWTGVPAGDTFGLYQPVTGPTAAFPFSQQEGVAMYKELLAAGKLTNPHYDPVSTSTWVHDGTNFFSVETPLSLAGKRRYIKDNGLAGVMMYSLESDDASATLLKAATGL
ncbi:glycoside hydrolase family 18 protein [Actinoplanes palleronii]|uniref:glycoside hydrolase family 18 protein n=1 Tax=Actinoplanes palleronii TaxID=113570 RepID=UPI0019422C68|nr:glycosyl hydrolase family 18 protein [Actinoplanes palleronii]